MPVKETANEESAAAAEFLGNQVDLKQLPGFHVVHKEDGTHLGTYGTREDAEAYVAGHLTPQEIEAEIVEGTSN